MIEEDIYAIADLDEGIYADLEEELQKAGYGPAITAPPTLPSNHPSLKISKASNDNTPPPMTPKRNKTGQDNSKKDVKKDKKKSEKPKNSLTTSASGGIVISQKILQQTALKPIMQSSEKKIDGSIISADILKKKNLKPIQISGKKQASDEPVQIDFRANLRKTSNKSDLKPPSKASIPESISAVPKILYRRKFITEVDVNNPPIIVRTHKPRLQSLSDSSDDTESSGTENGDIYDDVTNVQLANDNVIVEDVYDDVESINTDVIHIEDDNYDDVISAKGGSFPKVQVEDVQLYDDLDSLQAQNSGSFSYRLDNKTNPNTTSSANDNDIYDDVVQNSNVAAIAEDIYDELSDHTLGAAPPTTTTNNKSTKNAETASRSSTIEDGKKIKKILAQEEKIKKRRQRELEKNQREMEKKRKVFYKFYGLKGDEKPVMIGQICSENDLPGKQNLSTNIGQSVRVLIKDHKKLPKDACLAEFTDGSAIGFVKFSILTQAALPAYLDY